MRSALLFASYVFLSSFGLYKLKLAPIGLNFDFALGFGCYLLGFLLWFVVLKSYPLSVAFPVAAGALIVATQLIGFFLLNEPVTLRKELGMSLIAAGIAIIYLNL